MTTTMLASTPLAKWLPAMLQLRTESYGINLRERRGENQVDDAPEITGAKQIQVDDAPENQVIP
jgi:hypothetical protein